MKKVLKYAIVELGIFDYILFGQSNKAYAYSLLTTGIKNHCSKSFFYKCLAIRSALLLKNKELYLKTAERYFNKMQEINDPCSGAPRISANLFLTYVEKHNDPIIRNIAARKS